ncbi:hypothetical protein A5N17_21075 [Arthrobacter sp. D2]|nr:hypothetical protein [Arthrobacter sp. M5]NKR17348.1 hypothetical protein [Arthrobacter sp. M6]OEH58679.1 hypothetical protein A5N17_21075 [Arthrobacter sp. D2]OEH61542.1 hypothetical protein A5N13_16600 [Arthrobacter sp. D4]
MSSDPYGYFSVRIGMVLRWADCGNDSQLRPVTPHEDERHEAETARQFARLLGRPISFVPETSPRTIATQVATDAYALRHHAAESLVRLTAALTSGTPCVWEALSMGPNQLDQIVEQLQEFFSSPDAPMKFARLVLRQQDLQSGMTEQLASASNVFADWLQFSIDLLVGHELQLNAAHNKVKHGLSVRARDDLKVTFASTPPAADGTIPVSALTGPDAVDIFDRPVIEVLAQAPKVGGHRQGLELTQLRVDVPAVLAEAYMIAWAHGAMFHIAAARHFDGRGELPVNLRAPSHPGYPVDGPFPRHIAADAPVGMRFPLTNPPGGGHTQRPAGIAFRDSFIPLLFTGSAMRNIRVVADETKGA